MHTQEQRTKAVMLFIETGFNHAAVKSALGYPSRWSLDRWYEDYLEKGYVKDKRERWEKFSDDEKAAAVAAKALFTQRRALAPCGKATGTRR